MCRSGQREVRGVSQRCGRVERVDSHELIAGRRGVGGMYDVVVVGDVCLRSRC